MSACADVDSLKAGHRAHGAAHADQREGWRLERQQRAAKRNVERWFRELPPDVARELCTQEMYLGWPEPGVVAMANDWLLERGLGPKTPRPTRAPTAGELGLITALKSCRFPPASFAKRFARALDVAAVTDGQVAQVRRLVTTFRKQIQPEALHAADRHLLSKSKKSHP